MLYLTNLHKFIIVYFTFTTFFLMKDFAYFIRISLNVVIKDFDDFYN